MSIAAPRDTVPAAVPAVGAAADPIGAERVPPRTPHPRQARPLPPRRPRPQRTATPPAPPPRVALQRPRDCFVSGVSAGIARHLGAPVWAVRALFVMLALFGGAGVLLYVWCWVFMPWAPAESAPADVVGASGAVPARRVPVAWVLVAASVAGLFAVGLSMGDPYAQSWIVAAALSSAGNVPVLLGVSVLLTVLLATSAGVWAALVDRADPNRGPRHALIVRVVACGILVVAFLLPLDRLRLDGVAIVGIVLMPIIGLAVVLSSTLIEKWRELSGERVARIREEQRAEMAAHLHDSVLQTLALIQNRSVASSEVARLARAQERELRAWLYDGDQPADSDLPTDLRDWAGALELDYPVRIDVVSAGLSTERASGEVAAAAREAMLNAARHAGGEVSVYIEGGAAGVDVYIRDRGTGFAMDAVPGDRLGIRQSIIGRMRRAGGTAAVHSGGGGTEVHLRYGSSGPGVPSAGGVEGGAGRG